MKTEFTQHKCPTCGGQIYFDSHINKFVCKYCGNQYTENKISGKTSEIDNNNQLKSFVCNSCGAETITAETTTSIVCPFCDNTIINSSKLSGEFNPKGILPFEISKKDALDAYLKHISTIELCPDDFTEKAKVDNVRRLYVPYFLFNIHTEGQGIIEESWNNGNDNRQAEYHSFNSSLNYINVPHEASKALDDIILKGIEPFDFNAAKEFSPLYLSGCSSDRYDDDMINLRKQIFKQIVNDSPNDCSKVYKDNSSHPTRDFRCYTKENTELNRFCCDKEGKSSIAPAQKEFPKSFSLPNAVFNYSDFFYQTTIYSEINDPYYILCPIYILNMRYNDKIFRFVINGQTGKVVGRVPIDKQKKKKQKIKYNLIPIICGLVAAIVVGSMCVPAMFVKENMEKPISTTLTLGLVTFIFAIASWFVPWLICRSIMKSKIEQTLGKETAGCPSYFYLSNDVFLNVNNTGYKKYKKRQWTGDDAWAFYERSFAKSQKQQNKLYVDWEKAEFIGKNKFKEKRHF